MLDRAKRHWLNLIRGLWFRPLLIATGIAMLAPLLGWIERALGGDLLNVGFANTGATARAIVTVIAGSLITVLGLIFTLTIVTAQLVSQQFTPRALRGLLAQPIPQVIAGIFVGVEIYSLLVLAQVPGSEAGPAPSLAIAGAVVLGIVALIAVLVFVHHISKVVQLETIAATVARRTLRSIDQIYPEPYDPAGVRPPRPSLENGEPLHAPRPGYVQTIGMEELNGRASDASCQVELTVRPGDFVTERSVVARVEPGNTASKLADSIPAWLSIDNQRDLAQDPAFGIEQLADIAAKALSPGVNDPTTAISCIHYLCAIYERLAVRSDGIVSYRVCAYYYQFEELLELRFSELGRYAASNPRVAVTLLDGLRRIAIAASSVKADSRVAAVIALAHQIGELAMTETSIDREIATIERHLSWQQHPPERGMVGDASPAM